MSFTIAELVLQLNQKHAHAFTEGQNNLTSYEENENWQIQLKSTKKRKSLKIEVEILLKNFTKNYPNFSIGKGIIILPGTGAHAVLSMRGKTSEMYERFCEFTHLEYLVRYKRARVGWNRNKITFKAKIPLSQTESLLIVLQMLGHLTLHIEN